MSLEGFGDALKGPEEENGAKGFDETRRRLGRGCFMKEGDELGEATHDTNA